MSARTWITQAANARADRSTLRRCVREPRARRSLTEHLMREHGLYGADGSQAWADWHEAEHGGG